MTHGLSGRRDWRKIPKKPFANHVSFFSFCSSILLQLNFAFTAAANSMGERQTVLNPRPRLPHFLPPEAPVLLTDGPNVIIIILPDVRRCILRLLTLVFRFRCDIYFMFLLLPFPSVVFREDRESKRVTFPSSLLC